MKTHKIETVRQYEQSGDYATWTAKVGGKYGDWVTLTVKGHRWGGGCSIGGWGENDRNRLVDGGPLVAGPHAYASNRALVIDNRGGTARERAEAKGTALLIEAEEGDLIEAEGDLFQIGFMPGRNNEYVTLTFVGKALAAEAPEAGTSSEPKPSSADSSEVKLAARLAARAWWLVEAESADAARAMIEAARRVEACSGQKIESVVLVGQPVRTGRILASGGAK